MSVAASFETRSHVFQAGLELSMLLRLILLPVSSEGWDYRFVNNMPGVCSAGDQTQSVVHTRQTFYFLSPTPHLPGHVVAVCSKNRAEFLQQEIHRLQNLKHLVCRSVQ